MTRHDTNRRTQNLHAKPHSSSVIATYSGVGSGFSADGTGEGDLTLYRPRWPTAGFASEDTGQTKQRARSALCGQG